MTYAQKYLDHISIERLQEEIKKLAKDTYELISALHYQPYVLEILVNKGMWLEPTYKGRKR